MPSESHDRKPAERTRKAYEPPRIVTYDEAGLLDEIGPAVACARWDTGGSAPEPEMAPDGGREEPW